MSSKNLDTFFLLRARVFALYSVDQEANECDDRGPSTCFLRDRVATASDLRTNTPRRCVSLLRLLLLLLLLLLFSPLFFSLLCSPF